MMNPEEAVAPRWQAAFRRGGLILVLTILAWLVWQCGFNPRIRFLPPDPGRWIVFSLPTEVHPYPAIGLVGTFRRSFVLTEKPAAASLSWRCLTGGEVRFNGTSMPLLLSAPGNWKTISRVDVGAYLRQGTNEISVLVTNGLGPPALALELKSGSFSLASDETWEVSVSGSEWRKAQWASTTPRLGGGNGLGSLEGSRQSLLRCWPWLCLFGVVSLGGVFHWQRFSPRTLLILLGAVWLLLVVHNIPCLTAVRGFDAADHLAYINYIQAHWRLPDAAEGWEMFQAPLYYLTSAVLLALAHADGAQPSGAILLHCLSLVIGTINLALIFCGLRLIFPGDWKKPLAGLVVGTFLPAHIYLTHYVANETLGAMFVTGALCVALRLLASDAPPARWGVVLGILLGLALMSKASEALAVAVIFGVLAVKLLMRRERSPVVWLRFIGGPLVICLAIGGWHYFRLWRQYGNPLIGNWDPRVYAAWWQSKGYHTPGYYLSFGRSLSHPFFSNVHSFWDGLYATLWGDGLFGGEVNAINRPPWNYDFMTVGYLLALAPAAIVLTGLVRMVAACYRALDLRWLLLLAVGTAFAGAVLLMTLKIPSHAQAKAFYALPAMLPFCAWAAMGMEYWAGRGKMVRAILGVAMGVWIINVYASFWIRPETAQSELAAAVNKYWYGKGDNYKEFLAIAQQYPSNAQAEYWLAVAESKFDMKKAVDRLEQCAGNSPPDAVVESELARDLGLLNRPDEAIIHAERAVALSPEDEFAAQTLSSVDLLRKDYERAETDARRALALNPTDPRTHANLGIALMKLRQVPEAISQFQTALAAKPDDIPALNDLAAALAAAGRFPEAIATAERILQLAERQNNPSLAAAAQARIRAYQSAANGVRP